MFPLTLLRPGAASTVQEVFDEHAGDVWRTFRYLGLAEAHLPDLCQEVFVVVQREHGEFAGRSSLEPWLYRICVRVAADRRRRADVLNERAQSDPAGPSASPQNFKPQSRVQARMRLRSLLAELDDDTRSVLVLYELEGLSINDVSEVLACPAETVRSRLDSARTRLLDVFAPARERRDAMHEPERLREGGPDVPAELEQLFDAGSKDLPTEGDLGRLVARLGPVLEPALPPTWVGWRVVGKLAVLAVFVTAVAVLFALKFGPPRERPPDMPDEAPTEVAVPSMDPTTEAGLLERARNALGTDPALALSLTERQRERFASGPLAEERDVIAIQALERLGRTDEATLLAADFKRRYPNSTYGKKPDASAP